MKSAGETLARHLACFGELPPADRAALEALTAEVRDVPRQTDIHRSGDCPTDIVIALEGLLYRYSITGDGARQIHSFYLPNEAPSIETLYLDYMDNNLGTVVPSRIGLISHDQIYALIDERPDIRKLLWRQTLVQGAIFREWLARNSNMPAHAGLAHLFCETITRAKAAGIAANGSCALPLTQEFVADALGLTAVHTNRTLQALRETGAVEWRAGRLTVHDWPQLQEIARFDPQYLHLRTNGAAARQKRLA
ncbi:MAG TPA: Crp/Fnr family transcriptional regulator [Sphingomicrobium sp.]|nr:Crp/Fnr family transcriptional regulator [Sphingomicrobium sp.]